MSNLSLPATHSTLGVTTSEQDIKHDLILNQWLPGSWEEFLRVTDQPKGSGHYLDASDNRSLKIDHARQSKSISVDHGSSLDTEHLIDWDTIHCYYQKGWMLFEMAPVGPKHANRIFYP